MAIRILIAVFVFLMLLAYLRYIDWKNALVAQMADRATSVIGQQVLIGDLSIRPSGVIGLYDISIKNPEGFGPGKLLQLKRLYLSPELSYLLKGRLYFKNVVAYRPKLTLMRDRKGLLNLSDALIRFLSGKPKVKYRISEFSIQSGQFSFNEEKKYQGHNINLRLKNLSFDPETRATIEGTLLYAGGGTIRIGGWAYPSRKPVKADVSISSEGYVLSAFKEFFEKYGIDTARTCANVLFQLHGDAEKGFQIKSGVKLKQAGFSFFTRDMNDIRLGIDAFFRPRDRSITISDLSLSVNDVTSAQLRGRIADIGENLSYSAEINIKRLDLASFGLSEDLELGGIVTSDGIKVAGKLKRPLPEISGTLRLRDGRVKSRYALVEKLNASLSLSPDGKTAAKAEVSAKICRAGEYVLSRPAHIRLSTIMHDKAQGLGLLSSVRISPFEIKAKGQEAIYFGRSTFMVDGTLKGRVFFGKDYLEVESMRYGDYAVPGFKSSSWIAYREDGLTVKDLTIETNDVTSSAYLVKITLPENKAGYEVDIKNMNAAYPGREIELRRCNLHIDLYTAKRPTGNFIFSAGKIVVQELSCRSISAGGRFDKKHFHVDIPRADISGGKMKLTAAGRIPEGPFPLKVTLQGEGIDLSGMSGPASKSLKIPYALSGNINRVSFEGTIDSKDSLRGNALLEAGRLSLWKTDTRRNIVKDASLYAELKFSGRDCAFSIDTVLGNISAKVSGTVKDFMEKDRHIQARAFLPESKAQDIRTSFWDIFPDGLLYKGLGGHLSTDVLVDYTGKGLDVHGKLAMKDFTLEGENGEYFLGPVNGTIPVVYRKTEGEKQVAKMPSFDTSQFDHLSKHYARGIAEEGFGKLTIGSFNYGFTLLENMRILVRPEGSVLNIGWFSANIFGGSLHGAALLDLSSEVNYRAGFLVEGLSLSKLCAGIEPIKGYISGKVSGIGSLKGSGVTMSRLIGKADFWTYATSDQKTMISKEFLQKVGGPSLKAYLGDRRFNKGIMSFYLKSGYLIFKEMEISNTNFLGIRDLSVMVAPFNNRIAIDHLLWTITEAAERVRKKD